MGAPGCSDGPGPGFVVCATALNENEAASATVITAKLDKNLDFIADLFLSSEFLSSGLLSLDLARTQNLSANTVATTVPKSGEMEIDKPFVFSEEVRC
jgi:hypothetical protein